MKTYLTNDVVEDVKNGDHQPARDALMEDEMPIDRGNGHGFYIIDELDNTIAKVKYFKPKKENTMTKDEQDKEFQELSLQIGELQMKVERLRWAEIEDDYIDVPECIRLKGRSDTNMELICSNDKNRELCIIKNIVTHRSTDSSFIKPTPCKISTTPATELKDECVYFVSDLGVLEDSVLDDLNKYKVWCEKDDLFYAINDNNQGIIATKIGYFKYAYPVVKK